MTFSINGIKSMLIKTYHIITICILMFVLSKFKVKKPVEIISIF